MRIVDKIDRKVVPSKFRVNHCATICPYQDGVLVAFYGGTGECEEDQSVHLYKYDPIGSYTHVKSLPPGTGNPVIWNWNSNIFLLYSRFEKETKRLVDKWKYCSNWLNVFPEYGDLENSHTTHIPNSFGYLGRCQPIEYNGFTYVPMYTEHNCFGEIWRINYMTMKFAIVGRIGVTDESAGTRFGRGKMIQPTLWHHDGIIYMLARDIFGVGKAWFACSKNGGVTWTDIVETKLSNHNNSIVAIHDPNQTTKLPYVVWNCADKSVNGRRRRTLLLGKLIETDDGLDASHIELLNSSSPAAYPNYCFDKSHNLHIVHSDGGNLEDGTRMVIKHHVYKTTS